MCSLFRQEAPPVLKTSNGEIKCENPKLDCPLCVSRQSGIIQDSCEDINVDEESFFATGYFLWDWRFN